MKKLMFAVLALSLLMIGACAHQQLPPPGETTTLAEPTFRYINRSSIQY